MIPMEKFQTHPTGTEHSLVIVDDYSDDSEDEEYSDNCRPFGILLQPMKHLTTTRRVISTVSNVKFAFTMNSNLTNTRSVIIFEHFYS